MFQTYLLSTGRRSNISTVEQVKISFTATTEMIQSSEAKVMIRYEAAKVRILSFTKSTAMMLLQTSFQAIRLCFLPVQLVLQKHSDYFVSKLAVVKNFLRLPFSILT